MIAIVFTTIYHVTLTRWVLRWLAWRRHRRDPAPLPAADAVCDVALDGVAGGIGVVSENETLITMVELEPDPIAPTVVVENEERTINTLHINRLAAMLTLTDVKLSSIDVISPGHRAAGGFADLYQQMIGPVPAATHRRTWIVLRIALVDNLAAIARRGSDADAPGAPPRRPVCASPTRWPPPVSTPARPPPPTSSPPTPCCTPTPPSPTTGHTWKVPPVSPASTTPTPSTSATTPHSGGPGRRPATPPPWSG
ncbi:type VII secretion protein EccE [Mycobacterium xenopi 4042]|uniref:Type VII secretion protein EccE n=1 Tax=Mycobacterium xenopi 4042 TaxID=1299334 RepID=X7YQX2_MYCXE|nr:type VII secretion protein EccE [Mycobacterium xenopi 4042]